MSHEMWIDPFAESLLAQTSYHQPHAIRANWKQLLAGILSLNGPIRLDRRMLRMLPQPQLQPLDRGGHGQGDCASKSLGERHTKHKALFGRVSWIQLHKPHMVETDVEQFTDSEATIKKRLDDCPLEWFSCLIEDALYFGLCKGGYLLRLMVRVDPLDDGRIDPVVTPQPFVELADGDLDVHLVSGAELLDRDVFTPFACQDLIVFQGLDEVLQIFLCQLIQVLLEEEHQGVELVDESC